ncbi:MAG: exo-alpha-sialidase, partial [Roseimicrobium sp.]
MRTILKNFSGIHPVIPCTHHSGMTMMKHFPRTTLPLLYLTSLLLLHAATPALRAADDDGLMVPARVRDLALEPSFINTNPGPEYSDEQRDYAMVIGMDRTPKGRLWSAWVAGGDSDLGYFVLASSDDNGATWSKPRLVIDPPEAPTGLRKRILVGNLWTDPTGKLWLFYDQSMGYYDGRAGVWAITCDNPDAETPSWSAPRRIWHGLTLNKPLVLKNGEWLLPISLWGRGNINPPELRDANTELDDMRMAHLFVSKDKGETWTRRGGVAVPQTQFDEHMFVELNDGRLWMMVRTNYGIAETFSSDQGATWSEPQPSTIQNPSSRFHLRKLASGRILLVKNGPLTERTGRTLMTAYLTEDEGKTWKGGLVIDERNGVSYPDGFQAPDGTINIIHDRERGKEREILMARFTEEDILAGKLVSPGSQTKMLVSKALGPHIGEVTYNGLRDPGEWPPKTHDPKSFEPMTVPWLENPPAIIPINNGRQLFVDDFLIEKTDLKRTFHAAEKYEGNPVFKAETPFELAPTGAEGNQQAVCYLGHGGVFWEPKENLFKMFYTAGWRGGLALATSPDLINWTRPDLKLAGGNLLLPPGKRAVGGDNSVWLDIGTKNPNERI